MWNIVTIKLLSWICGVKVNLIGQETLPKRPFIIACKHQSTWETFYFYTLFLGLTSIAKQELTRIPLFGKTLVAIGTICIDRKAARHSIKQLIDGAKQAIENKHIILIFPEGTRSRPGYSKPLQSGITALNQALPNIPIIPVALNSGLIWPSNSLLISPGVITVKFLPAIKEVLPKDQLLQKLQKAIDSESNLLCNIK